KRVDATIAQSRRRTRPRARIRFVKPSRIAMSPNRLASGQVVASDDLILAALLLGVDKIAADCKRRPARPDWLAPHFDGLRLRPISLEAHATHDTVALRSTEARPVAAGCSDFGICAVFFRRDSGCRNGRWRR